METRVSGLNFESQPAAEAFAKIAALAGIAITLDDCPPPAARISARDVSGRLPIVLERLTVALGCTWREHNGLVSIQRQAADKVEPPPTPVGKVAEASQVAATASATTTSASKPPHAPIILKLAVTDFPAYALRDFLRVHGMAMVWGAGDVGSVATVSGDYSGETPLAVIDALLRAHGLQGIYARSNKTLYVR
ncbi:MAG: hypothetical protein PHD37_06635 [Gallionellaceae bacterium]|nr:hypothetical protein [Gallionellaceae bacterium]